VKKANILIACAVIALLTVSSVTFANESGLEGKPSASFPEASYTFAPVPEGTVIQHDYLVRNKGTADLEIQSVRTG
jgi:hypothetical protein